MQIAQEVLPEYVPRPHHVGYRATDLDCRLFPCLASKIQTSCLAPFLLFAAYWIFLLPLFDLWLLWPLTIALLLQQSTGEGGSVGAHLSRLGPPVCLRPGLHSLPMTLVQSHH